MYSNIDLICIFILSVITFLLFGYDKHCAVYGKRRIPEFLLLALSFVGGAFGGLCAMVFFQHKTKHTSFLICVPAFMSLQLLAEIILRMFVL